MRVLLVEDTERLGEAVRDQIADDGHAVDWVQTLAFADAIATGAGMTLHLRSPATGRQDGFEAELNVACI